LTTAFEALPDTILNAGAYYDHHLLFHLFLAPFAGVDPAVDGGAALTQGARIATVLLSAAAVVAVWWLLRGQRVPGAAAWGLVGVFGLMVFRSRRFVEYFPVFALVFLAFAAALAGGAPLGRGRAGWPAAGRSDFHQCG